MVTVVCRLERQEAKKGDEVRTPTHERKPESFSGKTLLTFQKSVPR